MTLEEIRSCLLAIVQQEVAQVVKSGWSPRALSRHISKPEYPLIVAHLVDVIEFMRGEFLFHEIRTKIYKKSTLWGAGLFTIPKYKVGQVPFQMPFQVYGSPGNGEIGMDLGISLPLTHEYQVVRLSGVNDPKKISFRLMLSARARTRSQAQVLLMDGVLFDHFSKIEPLRTEIENFQARLQEVLPKRLAEAEKAKALHEKRIRRSKEKAQTPEFLEKKRVEARASLCEFMAAEGGDLVDLPPELLLAVIGLKKAQAKALLRLNVWSNMSDVRAKVLTTEDVTEALNLAKVRSVQES